MTRENGLQGEPRPLFVGSWILVSIYNYLLSIIVLSYQGLHRYELANITLIPSLECNFSVFFLHVADGISELRTVSPSFKIFAIKV